MRRFFKKFAQGGSDLFSDRNGREPRFSGNHRQERQDEHHFRPRSRGGSDSAQNKSSKPIKRIHEPYHVLFGNLRPHEVVALFLACWETFYPYSELKEPDTLPERLKRRLKNWDKLFGGECTCEEAIDVIRREFSQNHEKLIAEVIRKFRQIS